MAAIGAVAIAWPVCRLRRGLRRRYGYMFEVRVTIRMPGKSTLIVLSFSDRRAPASIEAGRPVTLSIEGVPMSTPRNRGTGCSRGSQAFPPGGR